MSHRKITAVLAIAALMTLAVVTAGCTSPTNPSPTPTPIVQTTTQAGNNTTLTSTAGFKITFPSKYKYDQNGSTPQKAIIYLDPTDRATGVSVGTDQLQPNTTLDAYFDYFKDLPFGYQNMTYIQKPTNSTLAGKPAKTQTYQAIIPVTTDGTNYKNQTMRVQEIWTVNKDTGFVLVYKAPSGNFTKYQPEAQRIINTFQFT